MAIPGNIITGYLAKQPLAAIENGLSTVEVWPLKAPAHAAWPWFSSPPRRQAHPGCGDLGGDGCLHGRREANVVHRRSD